MALRQIVIEGDEILRKVSRPVGKIDSRVQILIDDMLQTMYASNGVGLAASQVGVLRRVFVMDIQDGTGPWVLINPRIVSAEGLQTGQEGCLSVPGVWGDVERPAVVIIEATDRKGDSYTLRGEGLKAVCICHEYDHLDGVLFKDMVKGELIHS